MDLRSASSAWVLCTAQVMIAALAIIIAGIVSGGEAALAALFGGLVAILPALFFAAKVGLRPESTAKDILGTFYQAELGKLALTALLFFMGAKLFGKHFAPLMLTCIACLAMNWLILAFVRPTDV